MNNSKKLGIGLIIQNQNGDFLLHLRDECTTNMRNQWSLVGGKVEQDETPEKAATRETKEETGLFVKNLTVYTTIVFDKEWDAIIFHAEVDSDKQKIIPNEGKKLMFIPQNKVINFVKNLSYSNPFLEVLMQFLNN